MKKITIFFLSVILISPYILTAQNREIDSLQALLINVKEDTNKVIALNSLSKYYTNISNYTLAIKYSRNALQQSEKLFYEKGTADALNNIGIIYWNKSEFDRALDFFSQALKIRTKIRDKKGVSKCLNNIGMIYLNKGNYEKSLENYLKSLKIKEEIGDKQGIAMSYLNIGNIYNKQNQLNNAMLYYYKALQINKQLGNKMYEATCLNNIGILYGLKSEIEKSLSYFLIALKIRTEIVDKKGMADSYNNIGLAYFQNADYIKALKNQLESVKIHEEIGNAQGKALSYCNIGNIYLKQKKYDKAFYYDTLSMRIVKALDYKDGIKDIFFSLSELYDQLGDYKQAYNYHKLYSEIKDTLFNDHSSKQIAEMNIKYDSEKKDKELLQKDAKISKQQAETEKQNIQRNAFIIGFILMLVLIFFIYKSYRQKQSANKILGIKNKLIEKQKQLVDEKNEKITDSIQYAKRIQQAILPSDELIKYLLPDSFIFFQPKDIVSGDFYWLSEKEDKILIAVADCTGHGVPGAFMSMIGNTLLNEIVNIKNIIKPDQILHELNKGIVNLLQQNSNGSIQEDGMDITILAINKTKNQIEFAGANHFSYYIHQNELTTLDGDVYSIGGMFGKKDLNFTSQKLNITNGDTLYLFTDGFIDQFGGGKNTKFLSGRFSKLLESVQQQDLKQQKTSLITAFNEWKGNNKQLDDVLVMGMKF